MGQAAVVLARANDASKREIDFLGKKIAKLTTVCTCQKVAILDVISVVGGPKDAINKIKELAQSGMFQFLVIATPKDLSLNEAEYIKIVEELQAWHGIQVHVIK